MQREGIYRCGCNFWWQDLLWTPTPTVPVNKQRVIDLAVFLFPSDKATHLEHGVHIAVSSPDFNVLGRRGSLTRVSPEEVSHAIVFKIHDLILKGASDEELLAWRKVTLSAPFVFELLTKDDALYFRAFTLRQTAVAVEDAIKRSSRQMAHEIVAFKKKKEEESGTQVSATELMKLYKDNVKCAKSLAVTEGFVRDCLALADRFMADPDINRVMDRLEEMYGQASCLNSTTKLRELANRTGESNKHWVFDGILDRVLSGTIPNDNITKSALTGSPSQVSIVECLKYRKVVMDHYLGVECAKAGFDIEDMRKIQDHFKSHRDYRSTVTGLPNEPAPNTQWISHLKESSIMVLRLMEAGGGGPKP